jgi:hypothetical protein
MPLCLRARVCRKTTQYYINLLVLAVFIYVFIYYHDCAAPRGAGLPYYWGFEITLRHTRLGRTPLHRWSARRRDLYLTTNNTHKRQISTPPAGFKPADQRLRPHGPWDRLSRIHALASDATLCPKFRWYVGFAYCVAGMCNVMKIYSQLIRLRMEKICYFVLSWKWWRLSAIYFTIQHIFSEFSVPWPKCGAISVLLERFFRRQQHYYPYLVSSHSLISFYTVCFSPY